jgi:hypothetical protein
VGWGKCGGEEGGEEEDNHCGRLEAGDHDDGYKDKDNNGDIDDNGDKDYGIDTSRGGMAKNDGGWGEHHGDQPGSRAAAAKAGFLRFHADATSTLMSLGRTTQASGRVSAGSTRSFAHCNEGNDSRRRRNGLLSPTTTKTTTRTTLVVDREGRACPILPADPTLSAPAGSVSLAKTTQKRWVRRCVNSVIINLFINDSFHLMKCS